MRDKNVEVLINGHEMGLSNKFKAQVIERRPGHPDFGKVVFETPLIPNLILDVGMNLIATTAICDLFKYCAVGDGDTPTEDDSGSITATTSGTTVTASSSIFTVGDVGKLLRFDTGEKSKIASYVNGTTVTLDASLGVSSPTEFTMYRVEQTALESELRRSGSYLTGEGNCGTVMVGDVITHQRTYEFPAESGSVTYNEVGFSGSASAGANLNSRGIFTAAPVGLVAGQQLRVVYYFVVTVSPVSARDAEVPINGWPALEHPVACSGSTDLITLVAHGFAADTKIYFDGAVPPGGVSFNTPYYVVSNNADTFYISATPGGSAIDLTSDGTSVILFTNTKGQELIQQSRWSSIVTASGNTLTGTTFVNEPYASKSMALTTESSALSSFPVSAPGPLYGGPTGFSQSLAKDSYVLGSYVTYWRCTYSTASGNSSSIRKFFIHDGIGSGSNYYAQGLMYRFDHRQEKSSLYTLTVVWKFSWDRDFI